MENIKAVLKEHGYARVIDIAAKLCVKSPSVTNMLQRLDEQKFVTYIKYRGVILTNKGNKIAKTLEKRHQSFKKFLIMIGISETIAEKDACEMEHRINSETVTKLAKFVEFVESAPKTPPFLEHFKKYMQTGNRPKNCPNKNKI